MNEKTVILVTGGCGFIGSHVAGRLLRDGHEVVIVDDLSTGTLDNLPEGTTFYCGSIADRIFLERVFSRHTIGAVIHEAARINTSIESERPPVDVRISIDGTINLMETALAAGVGKFLYASSVAVYGRPVSLPATEDTKLAPIYSYGIAKMCAEAYVRFYGAVHGLDHHILRYGNVYGPRQPIYGEVGVIAIFTQRVVRGEPLIVFGDGMHQRDFVFVDDAVDATVRLLALPGSDTFNVTAGRGASVNELFEAFQRVSGKTLECLSRPERSGEIGKFYSSSAKLTKQSGWQASTSLEDGIRRTIEYYRAEKGRSL
jgi:UDP-glucose 4-epimerase